MRGLQNFANIVSCLTTEKYAKNNDDAVSFVSVERATGRNRWRVSDQRPHGWADIISRTRTQLALFRLPSRMKVPLEYALWEHIDLSWCEYALNILVCEASAVFSMRATTDVKNVYSKCLFNSLLCYSNLPNSLIRCSHVFGSWWGEVPFTLLPRGDCEPVFTRCHQCFVYILLILHSRFCEELGWVLYMLPGVATIVWQRKRITSAIFRENFVSWKVVALT